MSNSSGSDTENLYLGELMGILAPTYPYTYQKQEYSKNGTYVCTEDCCYIKHLCFTSQVLSQPLGKICGLRQSHKESRTACKTFSSHYFFDFSPSGSEPSSFVHLWLYTSSKNSDHIVSIMLLVSFCILAQAKALRSKTNSVMVQFQVFEIDSREIWCWWCGMLEYLSSALTPKSLFYHHLKVFNQN